MVLSSMFKNIKTIVFKVFDLELEKGLKFCLKIWAFGTLDFMLIAALNVFKNLSRLPLKVFQTVFKIIISFLNARFGIIDRNGKN